MSPVSCNMSKKSCISTCLQHPTQTKLNEVGEMDQLCTTTGEQQKSRYRTSCLTADGCFLLIKNINIYQNIEKPLNPPKPQTWWHIFLLCCQVSCHQCQLYLIFIYDLSLNIHAPHREDIFKANSAFLMLHSKIKFTFLGFR